MLVDLERNIDKTDSKLSDAMRRMKRFIRQTEGTSISCSEVILLVPLSGRILTLPIVETKSGWCIVILIIILMALLLAVILV